MLIDTYVCVFGAFQIFGVITLDTFVVKKSGSTTNKLRLVWIISKRAGPYVTYVKHEQFFIPIN